MVYCVGDWFRRVNRVESYRFYHGVVFGVDIGYVWLGDVWEIGEGVLYVKLEIVI